MQLSETLNLAVKNYNTGEYKTALKYAERILKKDSQNADALIIKGNVFYHQKKMTESLSCYLQVLNSDSQNLIALINAANGCFELKDYAAAYDYAKRALKLNCYDKTALTVLGNAATELEKYDDGKRAFFMLLSIDSSDCWSYNSLSQIYQKTSDDTRALACGWQAVELSNGSNDQHINFGYLLYELGLHQSTDSIKKYAEMWLQKYGENPIVNHMANAALHSDRLLRADADYVRQIFDAFAAEFDDVLSGLEYRAPQIIAAELEQIYADSKPQKMRILDAGCGTGLCGGFLKKYAAFHSLYGVDISEKMLEKARERKVYDKLIPADLETYFSTLQKPFDLIVSADVLTYFGDLQKVISGMADSLSSGGRILLTVSQNNINDSDYFLHDSGRFLHHQKYVKKLLENNCLTVEKITTGTLRREGEKDVVGYLFSACKKA